MSEKGHPNTRRPPGDASQVGSWVTGTQHPGFSRSPRECQVGKSRREIPGRMLCPHLKLARTWPRSCQCPIPDRLLYSQLIGDEWSCPSCLTPAAVLTSQSPFLCTEFSPEFSAQPPRRVGFQIFTSSDSTDVEIVILWEKKAAAQRTPGASTLFQGVGGLEGRPGIALWAVKGGSSRGPSGSDSTLSALPV